VADYSRARERSFNTCVDRLLWLHKALVQHLKNRSAFINITTEDLTRLTDRSETIYSIDTDHWLSRRRLTGSSSVGSPLFIFERR
jgi:hypothetical protein